MRPSIRSVGETRLDLNTLQYFALWATIVLALSTVAALVWGVWTYRRSAQTQAQLLALGTLQHYLDLAVARPELASRREDQPIDPAYVWFAALALTTAQTLWTLVGHQVQWQRAINAIIRQHRSYLRSGAFVCDDFAPEFVSYLRQRVADLRCAEVGEDRSGTGPAPKPRRLDDPGQFGSAK